MNERIEQAGEEDWPWICAMLEAAGLPVSDLGADRMRDFIVARLADGSSAGAIAFERFATAALLRSLVVAEAARGLGVGTRLIEALEQRAIAGGVSELWLLTIDADAFFADRGYVEAGRSDAPDAIRATPEFSSLCPDDAVLMRKRIG